MNTEAGRGRGVSDVVPGLFAAAGVTGWLHARDLDTGREEDHGADHPGRSASTSAKNPAADAVIGAVGRRAVELLRASGGKR
jgi:hypothetical protein